MPAQERTREVRAAALPRRRQRAQLLVLARQRVLRRRHGRFERRTIAIEGAQVEAVFAAVPVVDLRGVQRQVRIRIAEHVAGPHIGLDVVDGRPPLRQTRCDVELFGHCYPSRRAARGIGFGVPIGGRTQRGGDLSGGPRPLPELVHDVVDRRAQGVAASDVHTTRGGAAEHQPRQMRSHGALDDVSHRLVLTCDCMQRRHVDAGDLRLSHTR